MPEPEILRPSFQPVLSKRVCTSALGMIRRYQFPDVATPAPTLHESSRAAFWLSAELNGYGEHALITLAQRVQKDVSVLNLWFSGFVAESALRNDDAHPAESIQPLEAFILASTIFGPYESPEEAIKLII